MPRQIKKTPAACGYFAHCRVGRILFLFFFCSFASFQVGGNGWKSFTVLPRIVLHGASRWNSSTWSRKKWTTGLLGEGCVQWQKRIKSKNWWPFTMSLKCKLYRHEVWSDGLGCPQWLGGLAWSGTHFCSRKYEEECWVLKIFSALLVFAFTPPLGTDMIRPGKGYWIAHWASPAISIMALWEWRHGKSGHKAILLEPMEPHLFIGRGTPKRRKIRRHD